MPADSPEGEVPEPSDHQDDETESAGQAFDPHRFFAAVGQYYEESRQQEFHGPEYTLEPEHVTKCLDYGDKSDERHHVRSLVNSVCGVLVVVVLLVFVIGLCWLFLTFGKSEHLVPILAGVGGLLAGALGGFGIGRAYPKPSDDE